MHLDSTVTIGNVIQACLAVGAVYASYRNIRERLVVIETRLGPLWGEFAARRGTRED